MACAVLGITASASLADSVPTAPVLMQTPPAIDAYNNSAYFAFSSTGQTSYMCSLDFATFVACGTVGSGSTSYSGLANGKHTFVVGAANAAGGSPLTTFSWTVAVPPAIPVLTQEPASYTPSGTVVFAWTTDPSAASYECAVGPFSLYNQPAPTWSPCSSPAAFSLADGSYMFRVEVARTVR